MYVMSQGHNLGHGHILPFFLDHGKIIWAMGFFSWAMAGKVALGEKNVAHGKMVKC